MPQIPKLLLLALTLIPLGVSAGWEVSESIDPMTDEKQILIQNESTNKIDTSSESRVRVELTIECRADGAFPVLMVDWKHSLDYEFAQIETRVDTNPMTAHQAILSAKRDQQRVASAEKIINGMLSGSVLKLRASDPGGLHTGVAVFGLPGFGDAWKKSCEQFKKKEGVSDAIELAESKAKRERLLRLLRKKRELAIQYTETISRSVKQNFTLPQGASGSCEVAVTLVYPNEVIDVSVGDCTAPGVERAVQKAILSTRPFPKPPHKAVFNRRLVFKFTF